MHQCSKHELRSGREGAQSAQTREDVLAKADDGGRPPPRYREVELAQNVAELEGLLEVTLLIAVNGLWEGVCGLGGVTLLTSDDDQVGKEGSFTLLVAVDGLGRQGVDDCGRRTPHDGRRRPSPDG